MPQRPRSHQIEDESRTYFRGLLPKAWVVRDKSQDYGIDLEVEIFEPSGESTGLLFYVQLRATEDSTAARSVKLKDDQLQYFRSLDLPTLVVRFGVATSTAYHRWHTDLPDAHVGKASRTYHFGKDDEWTAQTPTKIEGALRAWRLLRTHRASSTIAIVTKQGTIGPAAFQAALRVINRALSEVPGVRVSSKSQAERLHFILTFDSDRIVVALSTVASITLPVDLTDTTVAEPAVLYLLAVLLHRLRLSTHAFSLANVCLERSLRSGSEQLALFACLALSTNPRRCVQLATLNDLHKGEPGVHDRVCVAILTSPASAEERTEAAREFLAHAIGERPKRAELQYSMGNLLANKRQYAAAVRHFNKAQKLDASYLKRPYFLHEMGGALFSAARYRAAANWYSRIEQSDRSQQSELCLGDALLFSGKAAEAEQLFDRAQEGSDTRWSIEATLKSALCRALMSQFGPVLPVATSVADEMEASPDIATNESILRLDALHALTNFNLGGARHKAGLFEGAVWNFLVCAFKHNQDAIAWSNAIAAAYNGKETTLAAAIMQCALTLGGEEAIEQFRSQLTDVLSEEEVALLDRAAYELTERQPDQITIRLQLGGGRYLETKVEP